jgi:hypothetical protein
MDIRAILKERGVSDDIAESMIGNPAYTTILEGFVKDAEAGKTALLKANEIKAELEKWNTETVIPYGQKRDAEIREARAKLAAQTTYLKELKAQGYDVPDSYLADAPAPDPAKTTTPPAPDGVDRKFVEERAAETSRINMALISASERARDLLGHGLDIEAEYEDFTKNRRPGDNLRQHIDRKYDLSGIEKKRADEKAKKERDDLIAEGRKLEREEYSKKHGDNGETVIPRSSKFDRFKPAPDAERPNVLTAGGREEATKRRQEKYRDFLVQ